VAYVMTYLRDCVCVTLDRSSVHTFFFSSRRRHTRSKRDRSSDVCSSDLGLNLSILVKSIISIFLSNSKLPIVTESCMRALTSLIAISSELAKYKYDMPLGFSLPFKLFSLGGDPIFFDEFSSSFLAILARYNKLFSSKSVLASPIISST